MFRLVFVVNAVKKILTENLAKDIDYRVRTKEKCENVITVPCDTFEKR
jgi:hypothetical protein